MDTPSKERLVGAIIFVALIVLLVPEILSGPRHSAPQTSSSANSSTRTYLIDLGNPVKAATAPAADSKPPALPPPPVERTAAAVPDATTASAPAASAPMPTAPEPAPTPERRQADVKPAPAANKAIVNSQAWGAQLGSFAKAENAERLVTALRGKGYRAFVSPTGKGSHVLHRVRVGPEPTREAAETLVARLKRDGQVSAVVNLP